MLYKILFIQAHYFVGGHNFQSFNNLIRNLDSSPNCNFLVSLGTKIFFKNDFNKLNKNNKILTFPSTKNSMSFINVVKAFMISVKFRKKYDIFFYYDIDPFRLAVLHLFLGLIINKKIILYYTYNPKNYKKNILTRIEKIIIRNFFSKKNNFLFLRTLDSRYRWISLLNIKKKIIFLKSIDYHPASNTMVSKKGPLKFGEIGQIRYGKSLEYLNKFFKNNNNYEFCIIGGYANDKEKKKFNFIESKFISKKIFTSYDELISKTKKLDYLVLLYDEYLNLNYEVSTFYLAARLKIPIIFYEKHTWLKRVYSQYKCGLMIKSFDEFNNFYSRKNSNYLRFIKELCRYEKDNLNTINNVKLFQKKLYQTVNYK
jgi:hypothetical protein